jgi:hypothetical protein
VLFLIPLALLAIPADAPAGGPACLPDAGGFLTARLRGDIELDVDWREPRLQCTGMPRPDGRGMRLRFSATLPDGGTLAFLFAPPELAAGDDARAVPVNVTVLQEATGLIYGTRGDGRCLLDEVTQRPLAASDEGPRSWIVEARGFCTEPARALDDSGSVLLTRFDFRGRVDLPAGHEPRRPPGEPAP